MATNRWRNPKKCVLPKKHVTILFEIFCNLNTKLDENAVLGTYRWRKYTLCAGGL